MSPITGIAARSTCRAIVDADTVVFAVWLDTLMALVIQNKELLKGKVIVDPTNPIKAWWPDGRRTPRDARWRSSQGGGLKGALLDADQARSAIAAPAVA
jgi:predicted dinucleotide-binding enzyme